MLYLAQRPTRKWCTAMQEAPDSGERDRNLSEPFKVSVSRSDGLAVVAVSGMVDIQTAPLLTEKIIETLAEPPAVLVMDLSKVDFLGSAGMTILVAAHKQCIPPARFGVVATGRYTARPLHLVGLDALFSVYPSLSDALIDLNDGTDNFAGHVAS